MTEQIIAPMTTEQLHALLPRRDRNAHKGSYGRLLLLCGSRGFTGAAALAARGALRSGAGLISLGVPQETWPILASKLDEPMVFPLPQDAFGRLSSDAWDALLPRLSSCTAALLGPGLGQSDMLKKLVSRIVHSCRVPLVLDADGLNAFAGRAEELADRSCPLVLTPHEGEFARLSDALAGGSRQQAALQLARQTQAVVVLKGHRTVIADPDGRVTVNGTGNPGMAVGGSGDVLAGILCSFLAQGLQPFSAAAAAVYVHGAAGDLAAGQWGEYGMTPSDLIDCIPGLLL